MNRLLDPILKYWPLTALVVSAAMLATAHVFEAMGYAPCTLCLRQRETYWTAMAIAVLALAFTRSAGGAKIAWLFDALLTLCFLYGAGLAFFHVGVEFKWWPGPVTCASTGASVSGAAMDALLRGEEIKPPACDTPNWWFLGLTMAAWNTLVSLGLVALGVMATLRRRRA